MFTAERTHNGFGSLCCNNGSVCLLPPPPLPVEFMAVIQNPDLRPKLLFINRKLALAGFHANLDQRFATCAGTGVFAYNITGQTYFSVPSVPNDDRF